MHHKKQKCVALQLLLVWSAGLSECSKPGIYLDYIDMVPNQTVHVHLNLWITAYEFNYFPKSFSKQLGRE